MFSLLYSLFYLASAMQKYLDKIICSTNNRNYTVYIRANNTVTYNLHLLGIVSGPPLATVQGVFSSLSKFSNQISLVYIFENDFAIKKNYIINISALCTDIYFSFIFIQPQCTDLVFSDSVQNNNRKPYLQQLHCRV